MKENIKCSECGEKQWSITDCNYVKLFNVCWSCDNIKWKNKEITTEEFEKREQGAVEYVG